MRETESVSFFCDPHSRIDMPHLVETLVVHAYLHLTLPDSVERAETDEAIMLLVDDLFGDNIHLIKGLH